MRMLEMKLFPRNFSKLNSNLTKINENEDNEEVENEN